MTGITAHGNSELMSTAWRHTLKLRTILFVVIGFVFAVDVAHSILNAVYRPYTGTIDDAMHIVLTCAPFAYVVLVYWILDSLVMAMRRRSWSVSPLVVIAVVLVELLFTFLAAPRSGSSSYRPMFPDFAGGLIVGSLTVLAAKPHLSLWAARLVITATLLLWVGGSLLTDLLWYSEGTQRGTGLLWHLPIIDNLVRGVAYLLMLAGMPVAAMLYNFPGSEGLSLLASILTAGLVGWFLWRISRERVASIAVAVSVMGLGVKVTEWAAFIAD
jgi:hypothetical protein